ncbi:MAG: DNA translocase FtsK 4TM domain-containing protein [Paludibacteraceae bacterium]|nr:DNA translocase FtsK 4TM domain-containing protein [Paludibacteraceae bacterium]
MPRKSNSTTTNSDTRQERKLDVRLSDIKEGNWWQRTKSFLLNPRTRQVCGVLFLLLALFAAIACLHYFFSGSNDQSLVTQPRGARLESRGQIANLLGLPGAMLANWLIDGLFGLSALLLIFLTAYAGLRMLSVKFKASTSRIVLSSLFWLLWGSVTLAFIQKSVYVPLFFHLGGMLGDQVASAMLSYVFTLGTILILLGTLVIYLILSNRNFVPAVQRLWLRLTTKKEPKQDPLQDPSSEQPADEKDVPIGDDEHKDDNDNDKQDNEGNTIKIELTPLSDDEDKDVSAGVDVEIQPTQDEEVKDEGEDDVSDNEDTDITLDDIQSSDVELVEQLPDYDPHLDLSTYKYPTLDLLKTYDNETAPIVDPAEQQANADRIVTTLRNYGIEIERIRATVGPTVTLYEVVPQAGVRIAKIQSLENDIMLSLSAIGIRIIAPMPGKGTVGIEVPNEKPQVVSMHSVIASKRFQEEQKMRLPVALGRTITNEVFCFDLAKTPHLIVAGATGQGKSVGLNAIITSLLYKKHPSELKFVLVDPKMVEFSIYKPLIKHFMAAMPDQEDRDIIITDSQKVINSLNSLVIEMEDRYSLLADAGVRNLEDYNDKFIHRRLNPEKDVENLVTHKILHHRYMPYIVIIIDEYGDFIMQSGKEVERPIQRLTQKARAVGMHMILATQRPDVKVVTGIIKANVPTRIAFRTQSVVDSRTVLDTKGAEHLVGKGDLLYSGGGNITRIQCAFVDTPEVEAIVDYIHGQQGYTEPYQLPEYVPEGGGDDEPTRAGEVDMKRLDPMFADVARYVVSKQEGSTSRLQRAFEIGYNRAGKLSDQLEAAGVVGPNKGPKGRDVLIQDMESLELLLQRLGVG